jgi:hypothetical protein
VSFFAAADFFLPPDFFFGAVPAAESALAAALVAVFEAACAV